MTVVDGPQFDLDDTFARALDGLFAPWVPTPVADPSIVVLNEELARALRLDPDALRSPAGTAVLAGNRVPDGATPVAQVYAGHQFGGYSPRLGDGRAFLLGEIVDERGVRRDIHLKGSGRTPFARGGDGRAAIGPMLREYLIGEAMHALGVPTTRALAVALTGEEIVREVDGRGVPVPGAVLTRVASSHLRVGTFEFAAATGDHDLLARLVDYAIERHHPEAADAELPALALYDHVIEVQATLIARWMEVGFVHGVMNTDNTTISGETIDYGPCAFMDRYDPATVFSSIDHGGRYAYGNQPAIAAWNLARLGEALLVQFDADTDRAVELATGHLQRFTELFHTAWITGMRGKLGMRTDDPTGDELVGDLLGLMAAQRVDYTACFRSLSAVIRGDSAPTRAMFAAPEAFDAWSQRWLPLVEPAAADAMDRRNPIYVPRNHLVEEALAAAGEGDLEAFMQLGAVLARPFAERPDHERYAHPAPESFTSGYRTYCGT